MDKLHDTDSEARQLYAFSVGTLACKCALEKKEVMGGTDRDTSLHERHSAAVAELAAPINPDLSLIPPLCLRRGILGIFHKIAVLNYATLSSSQAAHPEPAVPSVPVPVPVPVLVGSVATCRLAAFAAWPASPGTALNAHLSYRVPAERAQGGPRSYT